VSAFTGNIYYYQVYSSSCGLQDKKRTGTRGLVTVKNIYYKSPFAMSWSKGSRSWFDKLTTNGEIVILDFLQTLRDSVFTDLPYL